MSDIQPRQNAKISPLLEENERAVYGERIVATLSQQFADGSIVKQLASLFTVELCPEAEYLLPETSVAMYDEEIVATLSREFTLRDGGTELRA